MSYAPALWVVEIEIDRGEDAEGPEMWGPLWALPSEKEALQTMTRHEGGLSRYRVRKYVRAE